MATNRPRVPAAVLARQEAVTLTRHEANVLLRVLARGNDHVDTPTGERQCVTWVVERIMRQFDMVPDNWKG